MIRPTANTTPAERIARITLGPVAVAAGAAWLTSAGSAPAGALEIFVVLAGLDLLVTGAASTTGPLPPYQRLGHVPASAKARRS